VVGAGVVLDKIFLNRDLRAGALVRVGRGVDFMDERGVASLLLENLERFRKNEVFLVKERAVVLLGVWVEEVSVSSSEEEFSSSPVLTFSREKLGLLIRFWSLGDRFLRLLANRERRELREASDLAFPGDFVDVGVFVVRRGIEMLGLDRGDLSLESLLLCGLGD